MPIYEYECKDCGKESEMLVRSSEEGVVCPSCGSSSLKKMFSTFAVSMAAKSVDHQMIPTPGDAAKMERT